MHRLKPALHEDLLKVEMETRIWGSGLSSSFKHSHFLFPLPVLSILGDDAVPSTCVQGGFVLTPHLLSSKQFKSTVTHQQTIFPFGRDPAQNFRITIIGLGSL